MPPLRNPKHEKFAINVAVKMMSFTDAIIDCGYNGKNRNVQSRMASNISHIPKVRERIDELMNKSLVSASKTSINSLHEQAVKKAEELLNSDNPQVVAKIIAEVLSRTEPVVRQSQSLNVNITGKDREKRLEILQQKREKMKQIQTVKVEEIPSAKPD